VLLTYPALKRGVTEGFSKAGLLELHNVLPATRRRPDEHYSTKDRGTLEYHLLRDHAGLGIATCDVLGFSLGGAKKIFCRMA
jgi:hypothetical protein